MKNKLNEHELAYIISDVSHGEITECLDDCRKCSLSHPLPKELAGKNTDMTICNMLTEISYLLNEDREDLSNLNLKSLNKIGVLFEKNK